MGSLFYDFLVFKSFLGILFKKIQNSLPSNIPTIMMTKFHPKILNCMKGTLIYILFTPLEVLTPPPPQKILAVHLYWITSQSSPHHHHFNLKLFCSCCQNELICQQGLYATWKNCIPWLSGFFFHRLRFLEKQFFIGTWKNPWILSLQCTDCEWYWNLCRVLIVKEQSVEWRNCRRKVGIERGKITQFFV